MADNTTKRGARDRAEVAGGETYEVDYFARKHSISRDQAQALIDRVGNDRAKLDAAVAARPVASTAKAGTASRAPAPHNSPARRAPTKSGGSDGGSHKAAAAGRPRPKRATAGVTARAASPRPVTEAIERAATVATKVAAATRRGSDDAKDKVVRSRAVARGVIGTAIDRARSAGAGRAAGLAGAAAAGLVTGLAFNLGRKAAVQAPSALAGDWLEALKVEHQLALRLFDQLQATGDSATARRTALLTQLRRALGKHAFTEENVIYPALRDWGDTADADKLNHDHGYMKQYLYDLEAMDNGSPAFLDKVAAFRAQLEAHIREEEDAIFPPLHVGLGEQGNAKVTALANREGFKLA